MPACKKELPAKKMRGCLRADLDVVPSVVQLAAVLDLDFGPDVASVRRLGLGAAHHAKASVAIQAPADHQAVPRLEDIQREELAREDIVHDEERQHARSVRHILHRFRSPLRSLLLEVGGQDALQRHGDWLLLEAAATTTDGLVSGGGCHVAGGAGVRTCCEGRCGNSGIDSYGPAIASGTLDRSCALGTDAHHAQHPIAEGARGGLGR